MNTRKSNIKGELELRRTQLWHILPSFARTFHPQYEARVFNRQEAQSAQELADDFHASGWFALKSNGFKRCAIMAEEGNVVDMDNDLIVSSDPEDDMKQHWWEKEGPLISPDDQFINVIDLTSSVTRYGGWCSAGSIDHRDQMIFASRQPNCIGHLFVIDTPGGSAYAKNDYEQGIAAARAAGQPVVCWIDGMCCSAGVAASCQTDEIYVQHPNCEVGCIGTMAAFYTLADGSKDEEGYVYHELYDPESFEKNLEFRELANNDNPDPLLQDLAEDGASFRELVRKCRPAVKEEMLHGKVYKASELEGILVDGVKTFDEVIQRIVDLNEGAELIPHVALFEPEADDDVEDIVDDEDDSKCKPKNEDDEDDDSKCKPKNEDDEDDDSKCKPKNEDETTVIINKEMKQYSHINTACGVEALAVTEDGSFFCNAPLAEAIEARLEVAEQNESLLSANNETVATLNARVAELKAEAETSNAAHAEEVANLNSQIEELNNAATAHAEELANLNSELEQLRADKQANEEAIANLNSELEQLRADHKAAEEEIEELAQAAAPAATPAPADVEEQKEEVDTRAMVQTIYTSTMTPAEKAKAREARMQYLQSIRR